MSAGTSVRAAVRVEPARVEWLEALVAGDEVFTARFVIPVAPGWVGFPDALPAALAEARRAPSSRWGTHLFFDDTDGALVGFGGFKGPPRDGEVEIGYAVAPSRQGRGIATEVVAVLVARAAAAGVGTVCAHTLAAENPSTSVLRTSRFVRTAVVPDPDLDQIWRWELALDRHPAPPPRGPSPTATTTTTTKENPMSRITRTAALLLVAPLALLAACSDGDDTAAEADTAAKADVAAETRLDEETWSTTVNELCADHNEALGRVIGPLFAEGPPADDAAQAAADEIVERTRSVTDQIDALAEPSAQTIHVAALVAALDAGSDQVEAMGGPAFFAAKEEDPYRRAADIAGEMGLEACDTEG